MRWGWVALALWTAVGCRSAPAPRTFDVRGQVLGIRMDVGEIQVAHEDIPGFMPAMSMSFGVRDTALITGLNRGDLIRATLAVTENDAWLTSIERTGHQAVPEPPVDEPPAAAGLTDLLEPGQPVEDDGLVDQDGRPFSIADARGRPVAVTFIYTRCPLPTFCPLMDRHFRAAQRLADARPDLRGKALFLSVTFDPTFDTPAILRRHADALEADLSSWHFLTGEAGALDRFATRFGVSVGRDEGDAADITHNLRTAVIGPDGRLRKIWSGSAWTPEELVAELSAALAP